jgi:predicted ATP-dependent serine protease
MKKPKTEQVKDYLLSAKLDDFGSVQEIINDFCRKSGETITYSQFHQIYKQFVANPSAFKQVVEMQNNMLGGANSAPEVEEEIEIVRMKDVQLDKKLFVPLKTGKGIDLIMSDVGGLLRGTINMVVGDPGAGKSTITADVLADLQEKDKKTKVLYVQGEQSIIDAGYYYNKTPRTGNVDNLFLAQYANPVKALEKTLKMGWDVIVMDSFNDILQKIKAATNMSTSAVETYLINLMIRTAEGDNDKKIYTSFFCIQQVTKGGEFVGSNTIKHATTAMMEVRFDENNRTERYVEFTKNRRCGDAVFKKLYFTLDKKTGQILYDTDRFQEDAEVVAKVSTESLRTAKDEKKFAAVFFGEEEAGTDIAAEGEEEMAG